jgi:predicted nucleic acid-binding protein
MMAGKRLVLDASAALHAVLPGPGAEAVLDALEVAGVVLAPDLYSVEVANALWKYVRIGDLRSDEAVERLERAIALVDLMPSVSELAKEALVTSAAEDHSVYDCTYAVLARREGATIVTADRKFAVALEKMRSPVVVVGLGDLSAKGGKRKGNQPSRPGLQRRQT